MKTNASFPDSQKVFPFFFLKKMEVAAASSPAALLPKDEEAGHRSGCRGNCGAAGVGGEWTSSNNTMLIHPPSSPSEGGTDRCQLISSCSSISSLSSQETQALEKDISMQCPMHAYRFSLRDFDVGGFLGDGAHGTVFVARERRSGYVCVLKAITKAHLIRNSNESLLKKEVELQAHLKHPHICCMYTWFHTASTVFLVMEYCDRGDLFSLLDATSQGFSEAQVARYLFQIGWAIRTCHDKRIAHLDIKPENILVNHNGDLKLADFGLSAHIGGEHRKRGVSINRGTCDYFSPEQCAVHQRVPDGDIKLFDEKADIWTLGVLAFELYFKFPPFGSQTKIREQQVMDNIRKQTWNEQVLAATDSNAVLKYRQMSPSFRSFLNSTLCKQPAERPTAEELLEHEWIYQNNRAVMESEVFEMQPRGSNGHRGFNNPGNPWQTPRQQQ